MCLRLGLRRPGGLSPQPAGAGPQQHWARDGMVLGQAIQYGEGLLDATTALGPQERLCPTHQVQADIDQTRGCLEHAVVEDGRVGEGAGEDVGIGPRGLPLLLLLLHGHASAKLQCM